MKISKKVILLGHFGVGKTSLVKRFVVQKFSEEYQTTIGVKINKVVIGDHHLTMILWDIEGGKSQQHLPPSYFAGAHGIIYVFDLTRPSTWKRSTLNCVILLSACRRRPCASSATNETSSTSCSCAIFMGDTPATLTT